MPFLSVRDNREVSQNLTQASFVEEASFGETFAAGVGQVFDEELSISSMLNMQGFNQRKEQVKELGNSGAFNINEYTSAVGDVDYERISSDFPDFKIKNDKTLFDERAELLKGRREYAQDVFDRGNGMAQFLGMATAYMLDPINIATMPIATAGTATKGLSTIGRAIQVGRNEAGLAVAAELMIQPLVYQHKHDINSPFEFKDALLNIVTAATGAAAIGGLTGGISGYLKNVREKTAGLPLDDDAVMALNSLARVEDDLNIINKSLKSEELTSANVKGESKGAPSTFEGLHDTKMDRHFRQVESVTLPKGKVGAEMMKEIKRTDPKAKIVSRNEDGSVNVEHLGAYKPLQVSKDNEFLFDFDPDALEITEPQFKNVSDKAIGKKKSTKPIAVVKKGGDFHILDGHHRVKFAKQEGLTVRAVVIPEKDFNTMRKAGIHQGEMMKEWIATGVFKKSDLKPSNESLINKDAEILTELNNKMEAVNQPSKVKEDYAQPEKKAATTGSVSQRERAVVERNGLTKDYDADIEAFKALDNPRIVQDDVVVDAGDFMKSIDDEIKGIEEVLTCAI